MFWSDADIQVARERTLFWARSEHPRKDLEIVPLVLLLNSIDGCATLYSCSGHGIKSGYVRLAVTENGLLHLQDLFIEFCRSRQSWTRVKLTLTAQPEIKDHKIVLEGLGQFVVDLDFPIRVFYRAGQINPALEAFEQFLQSFLKGEQKDGTADIQGGK